MGIDARWYCFSCVKDKSPETNGGRALTNFLRGRELDPKEIRKFVRTGKFLISDSMHYGSGCHMAFRWLEELATFLDKHKGHDVVITDDLDTVTAEQFLDVEYPSGPFDPRNEE